MSVLLPDGRVLCPGRVDPTHPVERDQRQLEVYSPPYLSAASRPQISAAPATAGYGDVVTVGTPDAANVDRVVLIPSNTVTHHTDAEHRLVRIPIVATAAGSVDVQMPASATVAPPGPYMLFLVDAAGVPSEAAFVRLG